MRLTLAGLVVLFSSWSAFAAHADVVGPEPEACPPGGQPATCHAGPHCRFMACESDADCQAPESCQALQLCRDSVICAGLVSPDEDLEQYRVQTVEGVCAPGSTCERGRCESVMACSPPASGGDDGGCSLAGAYAGSGGTPALWLLGPMVLGVRRIRWRAILLGQ